MEPKVILYEIFGIREIICFSNEQEMKEWIKEMKEAGEEDFKIINIA